MENPNRPSQPGAPKTLFERMSAIAASRKPGPDSDDLPARAAKASFEEDHSVGPSREGGSVKRSHRQEGRNFVD